MKSSTLFCRAAGALLLTLTLGATVRATDLLDVIDAVSLTDPIQFGRLSRNGVPQDWVGQESFPGAFNFGTAYHYHEYIIPAYVVAQGPFIQITFDDPSFNVFASAYSKSYLPDSKATGDAGFDTHWLGDAGLSGNFGIETLAFQVKAHVGSDLIIVVNNTAGNNGGVGDPFRLLVESFSDNAFSPAAKAPDAGASVVLLGLGLTGLAALRRGLNRSQRPA